MHRNKIEGLSPDNNGAKTCAFQLPRNHLHELTQRRPVCKLKSAYPTALSTTVEKHRSTSKNPVDSRLREPCRSLIPQTHPQHALQRDRNPPSGICAGQRPKISKTATSDRAPKKIFHQLIPRLSTDPTENRPHPRKSGQKPHKTSPPSPKHHPKTEVPLPSPKGAAAGLSRIQVSSASSEEKSRDTRRRSENQRKPQIPQRSLVLCVSGPPAGRERLSS